MWRAVAERDRRFDGAFYYGVVSTGVYCRPGCASRRPRRPNVRFFESSGAAQAAGFRPCRRCRPEQAAAPERAIACVLRACRYMAALEERVPTLTELGGVVGMSPTHFQRVFKRLTGVTPRQYADALRLERFRALVRGGEPVSPALYGAGFGSPSRLYEQRSARLGMTPRAYRRQGADERIMYVIAHSQLGAVGIAATRRGICAVRLGDSGEALADDLHREFARAELQPADARVQRWTQRLVDYLDGSAPWPKLPLDVRATAFQRRVWEALQRIPSGSTATYADIARVVGSPRAARAVGRACARNAVALVVPCHRVVPKGGGSGEYRWGAERKRRLLALEARRPDKRAADDAQG
jgi:AraC family transcriptional regulator of adaptative response/methylated-DNA-[protein]-cysteine methyltransferase